MLDLTSYRSPREAMLYYHRDIACRLHRHVSKGTQVAHVDYNDSNTIVEALKGHDVLIITLNVLAAKDTSTKLIRAAADAGVRWVLPNEFGVYTTDEATAETTGPAQANNCKLIEELGVSSWVGVVTGFWYEHALCGPGFYGFDVEKREVIFFDEGKERLNTSTWPQVGRGVAALLSLPTTSPDSSSKTLALDTYRNRKVFISSFSINQRDMFEIAEACHWDYGL